MSGQPSAGSPSKPASDTPNTSPLAVETPQLPGSPRVDVVLEQYKLAVEMAAHMSTKRQDANKFYISLVSAFGVLYSLLDKAPPSFTRSAWEDVLPILAVCWCFAWWLTIQDHRRLNMAKWKVIYKLENALPTAPFKWEEEELETLESNKQPIKISPGSFAFTTVERVLPILVGLIFLLLAARPLLDLVRAR
jgi:hypothetical protein